MLKTYNVQNKVTLFYNDYNTYFGIQQTLNLVNFINKDEPEKICGGIGMQSHVDIKVPTIELYGTALEKFLAAGYESSDYRTGCNDQLRYKRLLFLRRRKGDQCRPSQIRRPADENDFGEKPQPR